MDALAKARELIEDAYIVNDRHMAEVKRADAAIYAAIATAEQLKRIADVLEHPNRILAPDPQDYYREDEYNKAAELHDYHKNSNPGESLDEYRQRFAQPEARPERDGDDDGASWQAYQQFKRTFSRTQGW